MSSSSVHAVFAFEPCRPHFTTCLQAKQEQQRARQGFGGGPPQGFGGGSSPGPPMPTGPAAAPPLPADAIAKAVATAKEAAARIAASRAGASSHEPRWGGAAATSEHANGVSFVPPPDAGVQASHFGAGTPAGQGFAAPSAGGAPKMTPEEARRVAQQAAQRVSQFARGGQGGGEEWAWSKQ